MRRTRLSGKGRVFGIGAALCAAWLGVPPGASALTLADLVAGSTLTAKNGVTYENFSVKIRGGLSDDLESYRLYAGDDGFSLSGDGRDARGRDAKGKIVLRYDVSTSDPAGLVGGMLQIHPGGGDASLVADTKQLFEGRKKIAKLLASSGGTLVDAVDLEGLSALSVREKIKLNGGFAGSSISSGFSAVPEASTLLLASLGMAGLAAFRRRRQG